MRDFAARLYKSKAWQRTSKAYAQSVGGLCEHCLKQGVYKAGEIVHHKIHLSPENINDPSITLSWDNLELVCRTCHGRLHDTKPKRYSLDELGRVVSMVDE